MSARVVAGPASIPGLRFAVTGRLGSLPDRELTAILDRDEGRDEGVAAGVRQILDRVRAEGDRALVEYALRFDGVQLAVIDVPRAEWDRALRVLPREVVPALEAAASAIATFHRALLPRTVEVETWPGVHLTRITQPLERVGVYAPGGTATYPSSVLMGVVPARVAGVDEIVVCSPPGADGRPAPAILAAAAIAGADHVFAVGGAGAIAAMAFGTATVPRVDRIVGPGNAWVTEAKRQVMGRVGIDCPAGPSELLIVADDSASPVRIAAELAAQAEHDTDAAVVLISTCAPLLDEASAAIEALLPGNDRSRTIRDALATRGALLVADSLDDALDFASRWAPEHLLLAVRDPRAAARRVRHAGTIFLGETGSVTFGDYLTGANHVLPTARAARSFSGLDTQDYVRRITLQEVSPEGARTMAGPAAILAGTEGLPGHALAARLAGQVVAPAIGEAAASTTPGNASGRRRPPALRADYASLALYDPARAARPIDLSDNTNLFGPDPAVQAALDGAEAGLVSRYPSVYGARLKEAWADCHHVSVDAIATGCGSDDLIDSAVRAFCLPGDTVALPWPTFGVVEAFAGMNGAAPVRVTAADGLDADPDALLASRARLIYLCRPNNPTGASCARATVERLIAALDGILLIDEAYADFAGESFLEEAIASDNTIVLRTMSKVWGLPGLRVGIAAGPPRLIREIEKSRGPYKLGALAEHIAVSALRDGRATVEERIRLTRAHRGRLTAALESRGYRVLPSRANFVLVALGAPGEAARMKALLGHAGIGVRAFEDLPAFGDCIRITVGPWPMMEALLTALPERAAAPGGRP